MKYLYIFILLIAIPVMGIAQPFWYAEMPVHQNGRQILNPWNGGLITSSIAMSDLDQDGDTDLLFVGSGDGRIYHYTNDTQGVAGLFSPVNLNFGRLEFPNQWLRMALHDWDKDEYPDLFLGRSSGKIDYYHNTGASKMFPEFTLETVFFDSIDVGVIATPVFADLNGDGLDDLLIGDYEKGLFYYRRQTSGTSAFVFEDTLRNHLGQVIERVYGSYAPALADLDADGDLDLLLGSTRAGLAFYRNTGSVTNPEFTLENNDYILPPDNLGHLTPVLVDIENDGDYDLFMGAENGQIIYYRNEGTPANPDFRLVSPQLPVDFLDFGRYAVPSLVDLDNDHDPDFFVNTEYGQLYRFKNTGTPTEPVFERDENPFVTLKDAWTTTHTWADLDGDADFDLFWGVWLSGFGRIFQFQNNGTPQNAVLDSSGWLQDRNGDNIESPRFDFIDIDGDHDLDLFIYAWTADRQMNSILMYKNQGTPETMNFVRGDTLRDVSGKAIQDYDLYFDFVDLDLDANPDLCIGNADGKIVYYENSGTAAEYRFQRTEGLFDVIEMGASYRCIPALGDVDGDDDLDLIAGRMHGGFRFYRNFHEQEAVNYPINIAAGRTATASRVFAGHPPESAIDDNDETTWMAGEHPPHWIEIDLQSASVIGKIEFVVDQDPTGETVHQVWAKGAQPEDSYALVKEFRGVTANTDTLTYTPYSPLKNIRYIKIETIESPSWVAWREIRVFGESDVPTDIAHDKTNQPPLTFRLQQNYPNPFNPETMIRYQLPIASDVKLVIYNTTGQIVRTLVSGNLAAGAHSMIWNGRDDLGRSVSSGVYLYRLQAGDQAETQRMLLLK